MKRAFIIMGLCALVALAATSCKKEAQTTSSFKATLTQPTSEAKTGINNNLNLVWNEGDQIKVFDNNGEEYIFTTNDNGTTTATFTGTELDASASYVAFYPAENASIDGNIIKLGINANQTYAPNSFAAGTYPMVAKSEAGNLAFTFTSDCGLLAIPVKGSGSIGSIELTGKADEDLAGQLQYTIGGDFNYYDGSSKKVTLNCGGVGLGTDPKVFYFVLPSGVLHSGFTAVLKDIMGGELGTLSTDNNNTIEDQTVRMMPAVTVGQPGMVINVDTPQTSSTQPNQCTLTGSVTYDPGVVLDEVGFYYGNASKGLNELPANLTNKVTLANVPASGASFSHTLTGLTENTVYQYCVYVKTGEQEIYGSVENFSTPTFDPYTTPLTFEAREDGVTVELNTLDSYGSFALEYSKNGGDWTSLTNAVTLNTGETVSFRGNNQAVFGNKFTCSGPCYIYGNVMSLLHAENYATNYTLSESAFTGLFYNNSNINIPTNKDLVLPATTLANYCYYEMFRGCTGLTRTPELPATTMRFSCYFGMFRGCTGLTTVPADLLPTTTMNNASASCYQEMFYGCENLTAAPNLPATTLAMDCYRSMFYGCKSLTTAPELPATNLTPSCYYEMFYGCENLTTAPALPAETLENQCYYSMFRDCKSLTTAPTLPAPALVNRCYYSMFRDCIQLNSVTCLATSGINQNYNTANWLFGAASSGTFTKAASASVETDNTSWQRDTNGIPSGWNIVNYGAVLVESITLNKTATTLTVGDTETLSVFSVQPTNATDQTVTWSSDNLSVATVDATTGEVTAVAAGPATITATANDGSNVTATCAVTVNAPAPANPVGAINSIFNVGTSASPKYVYFSEGNLQYSQSADKWSFMEHQYDMVETSGMNVGTNYADQDIISLFGWGTGNNPTKTGGGAAEYENYTEWGTNTIYSGTTATTNWRTLTRDEWDNLFANHQYGYVMISNGSQWICGAAIDPSSTTTLNTDHSHWSDNLYSTGLDAFIADAEAGGWLFLPAAGYRSGTNVTKVSDPVSGAGYYWSSTKEYNSLLEFYLSNYLWIKSNQDAMINRNPGFIGHSVRLVKDAE